mmetsp:Transcript_7157/g.17482  ORF Transcript_7157/g.17482 Transcript_7157/m.17482 type:complete len:96 (+) Transcript_7157:42-329(+)
MTMVMETKQLQHQQMEDEPRPLVGVRRQHTIIRINRIRGLKTTMFHLTTITIMSLAVFQMMLLQRSSSSSRTVIDDLMTILPPDFSSSFFLLKFC